MDGAMWVPFCRKVFLRNKRDAERFVRHHSVPSNRCRCAEMQIVCDGGGSLPEFVTPLCEVKQWILDQNILQKQEDDRREMILKQRFLDKTSLKLLQRRSTAAAVIRRCDKLRVNPKDRKFPVTKLACVSMLSATNTFFYHETQSHSVHIEGGSEKEV